MVAYSLIVIMITAAMISTGCTGSSITHNEGISTQPQGDGEEGGGGDLSDEGSEQEFYDRFSEERPEDLPSWVIILSPEVMEKLVNVEEDSLTFERGPEILEEVEPMDVLFHAHETFLLARRVLEIEKEETLIVFQTVDADLEDIFPETDGE